MTDSPALLILGLLLGVRHALDPDHVVAMGTISANTPGVRRSLTVGALWGLGHSLTVLAVGGAIVLLGATLPPRAGLAMEFAVALMLIGLGVLNLHNARLEDPPPPSRARPFLVGMVHGMAGSAAIALLVLATIQGTMTSLAYLGLFGAGTVGGMMAVTTLLAYPVTMAAARSSSSRRWLTAASGVASLVFGVLMVYGLGGPWALLSTTPVFVPR